MTQICNPIKNSGSLFYRIRNSFLNIYREHYMHQSSFNISNSGCCLPTRRTKHAYSFPPFFIFFPYLPSLNLSSPVFSPGSSCFHTTNKCKLSTHHIFWSMTMQDWTKICPCIYGVKWQRRKKYNKWTSDHMISGIGKCRAEKCQVIGIKRVVKPLGHSF